MKKDLLNLINDIISLGKRDGILHHITEDHTYNGRTIKLNGKEVINFGSYSYLGLETDQRLKDGAIDAIQRFGIQYPSSRSYTSCTLYTELETLIQQLFKAPVVLATSTSLGHQAVIPILVEEGHVIILDQQVHSSVRYAAVNTQHEGVVVTVVRHNNLEELEKKIIELAPRHKKIWYTCDGVYSMYGNCAPLKELIKLLDRYPSFNLYVDDAHGMSWTGMNGAGYALSQVDLHPRMILATSLNKAFAAGGAVFVIPDADLCEKVKNCGGPLIFAGQHQNAALGAGIACAKIHLSDEITILQKELADKIAYCQSLLEQQRLPLVSSPDTPVFFIGLGLARVGYNLVKRMLDEGYFMNLSIFPAVPESCTGVRFSITRHLGYTDIENMVASLAYHFKEALREEGRGINDIQRAFRRVANFQDILNASQFTESVTSSGYSIQCENSIEQIPEEIWNRFMEPIGMLDWKGLKFIEETFNNNDEPENNWKFYYYIIRDEKKEIVLMTYFTLAICKDDLLSPVSVSKNIELQRLTDPYYLCSKTFTMGSLFSVGQHLYLDRTRTGWKDILMCLLDTIWNRHEQAGSNVLILRDFNTEDTELREFFLAQGFIASEMPDTTIVENIEWENTVDYLNHFKLKKRYALKREILDYEKFYETSIVDAPLPETVMQYYELYKNVKNKSLELNSFSFSPDLIQHIVKHPQWEVIELKLKHKMVGSSKGDLLVGVCFCYKTKSNYSFVLAGMDYDYLLSHNVYKQMLWQVIKRANDLKFKKISLGLTASQSKRKVGGKALKQVAYVQVKDKYNVSVIAAMSNQKQLV